MDQQHRTTFCALEDACTSFKPAISKNSGFSVEAVLEMLREGAQSLFDGWDVEAFWFINGRLL